MNKLFWSLARQRKFDFCRRAFFLQYIKINPNTTDLLRSAIELGRREQHQDFLLKNFLIHCLRQVFYNRNSDDKEVTNRLFKEGYKWGLERQEIRDTAYKIQLFQQSIFFSETALCLVHHLPSEEVESLSIDQITVQGIVHFVWMNKNGRLHIVNNQKTKQVAFQALYAIKKYGIDPEKLDVGFLNKDFTVSWEEINWHEIQETQDLALSFPQSVNWEDFPATNDQSRCQLCAFMKVCDDHQAELALYGTD